MAILTAIPVSVWLVALAVGVVYLVNLINKYLRSAKRIALYNKLPGPPPGWPVIGHLPIILKSGMSAMEAFYLSAGEMFDKYGKDGIFHLALGPDHIVFLCNSQTVEKMLTDNFNIKKDMNTYDLLREWWGRGLISSWGDKWRARRKILTPAFHFNILQDFLPIMNDQSDILIKSIREVQGKPVDVTELITRTALDVIGETSMGVKLNSQSDTNSEYLDSIKIMGETVVSRTFGDLHLKFDLTFPFTELGKKYRKALIHLVSLTKRVIEERKEYLSKEIDKNGCEVVFQRKALPLLDILLKYHLLDKTGKSMTLQDVLEETEQFMFAGHDTTSYAISWALYTLGHNLDCLAKVHAEMDSIFADDPSRQITSADLADMIYLDMCLKESMRVYPTVPMVARETLEEMEINGYKVPAGSSVYVMLFLLGRDEKNFPDWQKFDPERFSAENMAARDHFAYVPFSAGPRNCIGQKYAQMEAKTVLAKILRDFSVKSIKPRSEMRVEPSMILRPVGTIDLIFTPRK